MVGQVVQDFSHEHARYPGVDQKAIISATTPRSEMDLHLRAVQVEAAHSWVEPMTIPLSKFPQSA